MKEVFFVCLGCCCCCCGKGGMEIPDYFDLTGESGGFNLTGHSSFCFFDKSTVGEKPFSSSFFFFRREMMGDFFEVDCDAWNVQKCKPDWKSYFLLVSHVSFLLPLGLCVWKGLKIESITLFLTMIISFLYHLCDEHIFCLFFVVDDFHMLDVTFTFVLVGIFCAYLSDLSPENEPRLQAILTILAVLLVKYDRFSPWINALLWFCPIFCAVYRIFLEKRKRKKWRKMSFLDPPPPRVSIQLLSGAALCLVLGVIFFVLGNTICPTLPPPSPSAIPCSPPEYGFYWFYHSMWHLVCMASVCVVVMSRWGGKTRRMMRV